jgi:uncharacterized integral membrane protein
MKLPQMVRNLWIYRRLLALAVLLGVALFFVLSNREPVKVSFPFLGGIDSTSGIVMLVSAGLGALVCWLVMTFRHAIREARERRVECDSGERPAELPESKARTGSEPEKTEWSGPKSAGP